MLDNKTPNMSEPLLFKKDFDDVLFSDQQLKMLNEMLAAGNLSRETFWQKLKTANNNDFFPSTNKPTANSNRLL
jgi:hypothetical protein